MRLRQLHPLRNHGNLQAYAQQTSLGLRCHPRQHAGLFLLLGVLQGLRGWARRGHQAKRAANGGEVREVLRWNSLQVKE